MIARSLVVSLTLVFATTPAFAQEAVSVEVRVADLDLTSPADRERFDARLKYAARNACRNGFEGRAARAAERECETQVIQSALEQID